ncbi:MAG: type II secretion system protein [Verrucomicrobiota bacterium]
MPTRFTKSVGFALIELIVVVAIIAVLAGLLIPAIATAKRSARSLQCLNQMRQIAFAIRLYAEDNDDLFPRSQHSAFPHGQLPWGRAIASQLGEKAGSWSNLLRTVYRCPADQRDSLWSYGQNVYFELDPATDDYPGSPLTWRRMAAVPMASGTILDAESNTAADHVMPHFWQEETNANEVAQQRHQGASNYSFVDGHTAARHFAETYAPSRQIDAWNPSLAR